MFRYFILFIGVSVYAQEIIGEEEKKQLLLMASPVVEKCMEEFKISKDDLMEIRETHSIENMDPCFFACCFKGHGLIDAEGNFSTETSFKTIEQYVKNEDAKTKLRQVAEICLAVNDKPVSDGKEGCDRSKLLIECWIENKNKLS